MKANQAFKHADEAVSPVIGVILMVAITVVLAAVVFVMVSRMSSNNKEDAPDISFDKVEDFDGAGAHFVVAAASSEAGLWGGYHLIVDDQVFTDGGTPAGPCHMPASASSVEAGNRIVCDDGMGDPPNGTRVQLRHVASNTLINVGRV